DISWRKMPRRIFDDQKDIWLFPLQLAKGKHWVPALAVTGATAGLIVADPHPMPYFRSHAGKLYALNAVLYSSLSPGVILAAPVSFLITGYGTHNTYAVKTGLLATEAYADSTVVDVAIKGITRRKRPRDVAPGAPFNDTFFNTEKSFYRSSFPSGHAAQAF